MGFKRRFKRNSSGASSIWSRSVGPDTKIRLPEYVSKSSATSSAKHDESIDTVQRLESLQNKIRGIYGQEDSFISNYNPFELHDEKVLAQMTDEDKYCSKCHSERLERDYYGYDDKQFVNIAVVCSSCGFGKYSHIAISDDGFDVDEFLKSMSDEGKAI